MKTLLYPKTYATVVRVHSGVYDDGLFKLFKIKPSRKPLRIIAVDDNGNRYDLALKFRRGRGHCGSRGFDFGKGTRIKVYKRNGIFRFSRVGA